MGFFKSQLLKIIEWKDDSQDVIVYRFPMHDGKKEREIMTGSSLTVRESQAAIFVSQGQIADVFGPGRYKLSTRNLPFLTKIGHVFYDGDSKFKCEVYFVNTKQFTNQKWGTANPITMRDADFGVIRIRGYGVFSFRVINPALFLKTLFGTNSLFTVEDINEYLKSMLISCITDTIAESKVSALDLAGNLQEFNDMCQNNIQHKFEELGLSLTNLTIENISFPENIEKALDERATLGILGDKMGVYAQKKAADALGDAAKNNNSAAGTFIGMGLGQTMGSAMGGVFSNIQNAEDKPKEKKRFCPECGHAVSSTAKFCPECGSKIASENVCPECGNKVKPTAKFCPECGHKLK